MTTSEAKNEFGLKSNESHSCARRVQQLNGDVMKKKRKTKKILFV
jgi:hypothetical protein